MRFMYTNNFVSSDLFNATGASLIIFTMNLNRCCTKFAKYMAGTYETSLILDPSFQIHGRKLQYVANPRPPKLWTPRPDLKGPPAKAVPTGEAYTPSRFLQKILDSVHHNMMFQGPWQSSYLPNPQGLLTASAHSVHAAYSGKQCAERLFHFLIPQARA